MAKREPKYPEIRVKLAGEDGNAFAIMGRIRAALKAAGHQKAAFKFIQEAKSGDYDHLLRVADKFVTIY